MFSPLNSFFISSILGKVIILTLLSYTLYYNIQQTNKFVNIFNINIWNQDSAWDPLKTNALCSYIFSAFLLVLILSVIRKIF